MTDAVVFLNFDGVLNSGRWLQIVGKKLEIDSESYCLHPDMVERVNRILEASGAVVVVSSAWRIGRNAEHLERLLKEVGFRGQVVGVTPIRSDGKRPREIQEWLFEHPEIKRFIILDDDPNATMGHLAQYHVQTTWADGLTDEQAERAIKIINGTATIMVT